MTHRYGITVPFAAAPARAAGPVVRELADLGYTDFWSSEADGTDGFTPLVLASQWTPDVRLGVAIVPVYTHGPAAARPDQVASLCEAAPGTLRDGRGLLVQRDRGAMERHPVPGALPPHPGHGALPADSPHRCEGHRDLRDVRIDGFTLRRVPDPQPPILVAGLREGMLRLAGSEGDGAIINWLSADDVATVAPYVHVGGPGKEIVARIFVCPSTERR